MPKDQKYRIEVEDDKGLWHDERGTDGAPLLFDDEASARAKLAELYPVLVKMENYGGGKRTRVIRVLVDKDDWPVRPAS
jgi:biotin carboxylase